MLSSMTYDDIPDVSEFDRTHDDDDGGWSSGNFAQQPGQGQFPGQGQGQGWGRGQARVGSGVIHQPGPAYEEMRDEVHGPGHSDGGFGGGGGGGGYFGDEDDGEAEAAGYGMTLDQYMSSMITTPASAAATSGAYVPDT